MRRPLRLARSTAARLMLDITATAWWVRVGGGGRLDRLVWVRVVHDDTPLRCLWGRSHAAMNIVVVDVAPTDVAAPVGRDSIAVVVAIAVGARDTIAAVVIIIGGNDTT